MRGSALGASDLQTRAALERALALSRELAAIMSETAPLEAALRECLAKTCAATAWELGQAWMASRMRPRPSAAG